jgi:hypothetical protein
MSGSARRTNPKLWDQVKHGVTRGDKGGKPGQWSARKAQIAISEYKKRGGGYEGEKRSDNHLAQWTREDWGTKSGKPSGETGERYLPRNARNTLSDSDYRRTTVKKRKDTAEGRQFSRQPDDIADKVAPARAPYRRQSIELQSRSLLMDQARKRNIPGRSRMSKRELAEVLQS